MVLPRRQCLCQGGSVSVRGAVSLSGVQCLCQGCTVSVRGALSLSGGQCLCQGCSVSDTAPLTVQCLCQRVHP